MNQADHVWLIENVEGVREQHAGGLGRVAATLILGPDRPAELESGPTLLVRESHTADEITGGFLLDGVVAVAAQRPMSNKKRHVSPRRDAIERLAAEVAHDVDARAPLFVRRKVALAQHSKAQSFSL